VIRILQHAVATAMQVRSRPCAPSTVVTVSAVCPSLQKAMPCTRCVGRARLSLSEHARLLGRALHARLSIAVSSPLLWTALGLIITAGGWVLEESLRSDLPASAGQALGFFFVIVVEVAATLVGTAPLATCAEQFTPRVIPLHRPVGQGSAPMLISRGAGRPVGVVCLHQGSDTGTLPWTCAATSRAPEEAAMPSAELR
jgi:hypothetical protein